MKSHLEPVKNVLSSFLAEIEAAREMQCCISAPTLATSFSAKDHTPDFNTNEFVPQSDASFEKEKAYIWLFAEPWHYRALMHRPKLPQIPEYYQQPALPIYQQWHALEKEIFYRGRIIPSPDEKTSLNEYLQQLAFTINEKNEKRAVWTKSLRCFLQFIREDTDLNQHGPLEVIFPRKMKFKDSYSFQKTKDGVKKVKCRYILRLVDDEIYPIDIFAASDILQHLANTVLNGRTIAQHTAAEALGFTWLCHAIGSAQLMTLTREEIIHDTLLTSLKFVKLEDGKKYFQPECFITIQTFYGPFDIPISKTLYDFLIALPRDQNDLRIFSKAPSALLRTFYNQGVNASERARKLGRITFRTFTSRPLENTSHRPSPMKKPSKSKKK